MAYIGVYNLTNMQPIWLFIYSGGWFAIVLATYNKNKYLLTYLRSLKVGYRYALIIKQRIHSNITQKANKIAE